jgi:hypothetical protein
MTGVILIFMTPVISGYYRRDYSRIHFPFMLSSVSNEWSLKRNDACESTLAESAARPVPE